MRLHLGTCSFTGAGWKGPFYPPKLRSTEYLSYYASQFDTVEIDSTFYATPAPDTVRAWNDRTPAGFTFALKVPKTITHEAMLVGADREMSEFLQVLELLGDKVGPILIQLPYFSRAIFPDAERFIRHITPFLASLPREFSFALEVRNKTWIAPPLLDALSRRGVALALIDHPLMSSPEDLMKQNPVTAGFSYLRWLGDRQGIERMTKKWGETIIQRDGELEEWARVSKTLLALGITIFGYANNHYAGHAPATVRSFRKLIEEME